MIDERAAPRAAVLVSLERQHPEFDGNLEELRELVASAGVRARAEVLGRQGRVNAATYVGSGKVAQIAAAIAETGADLVIFNHDISPIQARNLEQELKVGVSDRTDLILEIFARRAKSHEGKLQVELAQLERQATRLVRGWTHLERQKGGIGLRGGPGETQLELDRRILGERIARLKDKLVKLRRQREVQRRARRRGEVFTVSLVGYTNAGKSTLFNRLTRSEAYAADQLFATLDTTSRRMYLGPDRPCVVSDTVGFIRGLPHSLVAAFRATLEETAGADLLVHVVDAANSAFRSRIKDVDEVLEQIGASETPKLLVMNKIDACGLSPGIERDDCGRLRRVFVSARTGAGLDGLRNALVEIDSESPALAIPAISAPDGPGDAPATRPASPGSDVHTPTDNLPAQDGNAPLLIDPSSR